MATGNLWNIDNPLKPWALFDTNAEIVIPFELEDWLASLGSTYASHEIVLASPLECVSSDYTADDGGLLAIRIKVADGATFTKSTKYPFTVRLVCADGQTDDRTLWLKLVDR
jgi:hypothetical protein